MDLQAFLCTCTSFLLAENCLHFRWLISAPFHGYHHVVKTFHALCISGVCRMMPPNLGNYSLYRKVLLTFLIGVSLSKYTLILLVSFVCLSSTNLWNYVDMFAETTTLCYRNNCYMYIHGVGNSHECESRSENRADVFIRHTH